MNKRCKPPDGYLVQAWLDDHRHVDVIASGSVIPSLSLRTRVALTLLLWPLTLAVAVAAWRFNVDWSSRLPLSYSSLFLVSVASGLSILFAGPNTWFVWVLAKSLNPALIGLVAGTGSAVGELSEFVLGRSSTTLIDAFSLGHWVQRLRAQVAALTRSHPAIALFLFALVPTPLFDLVGFLAGATGVGYISYFLIVGSGRSLRYAALAFLVHYLF